MARIEASTHIEVEPQRVWDVLVDWEAQSGWMVDARSVTVLSPERAGSGVVLRCRTDLAGAVVTDDMVVTEWQEPRSLVMRHLGLLIRGIGAFELTATRHGTHVVWWEEIDPPFGGLGEAVGTLLVAPAVQRVFRASLANLKRVCESLVAQP